MREIIFALCFLSKVEGVVHQDTQGLDGDRVVLELLTFVIQSLADRRDLE